MTYDPNADQDAGHDPAYDDPEATTGTPAATTSNIDAGNVITYTYPDAAGNDVTRYGVVLEIVDNVTAHEDPNQGAKGARIAWLSEISDPVPLDQLERAADKG